MVVQICAQITAISHRCKSQLGRLGNVHGGDGFLVNVTQAGVTLAHDLAQAQLGQLFRQGAFLVELAALKGGFVLQEAGVVTTSFKSSLQMRVGHSAQFEFVGERMRTHLRVQGAVG